MTTAAIITLADEVVKDLNNRASLFGHAYKAERKYRPVVQLEDVDNLVVTVTLGGWTKEPDTRKEWSHQFVIDIGIQYRAGPKTGNEATKTFDGLLSLAEQIGDTYEDTRPTLADCVLTAVEYGGPSGLPYLPAHIQDLNQFTGVIRLTFTKYR